MHIIHIHVNINAQKHTHMLTLHRVYCVTCTYVHSIPARVLHKDKPGLQRDWLCIEVSQGGGAGGGGRHSWALRLALGLWVSGLPWSFMGPTVPASNWAHSPACNFCIPPRPIKKFTNSSWVHDNKDKKEFLRRLQVWGLLCTASYVDSKQAYSSAAM